MWLFWLCHLFNRFLWLQTVCSAVAAHCCAGVSPPLCVSVSYIMLCSSGMKVVRETGRSLEPEVEEPAMARNHTHLTKRTYTKKGHIVSFLLRSVCGLWRLFPPSSTTSPTRQQWCYIIFSPLQFSYIYLNECNLIQMPCNKSSMRKGFVFV